MCYRWREGDLLFSGTGGENVTLLSIRLVTLFGVSILTVRFVFVCVRVDMHERA